MIIHAIDNVIDHHSAPSVNSVITKSLTEGSGFFSGHDEEE